MATKGLVNVFSADSDVLSLVEQAGRDAEFSVRCFASLDEYPAGHKASEPCCLIVDLRSTGLTLDSLGRRIRESGITEGVLCLQETMIFDDCEKAVDAGVFDVLPLPLQREQLEAAVREVFGQHHATRDLRRQLVEFTSQLERLTARQREVLKLIAAGQTIKMIAAELGVSSQTAAKHRARVLQKLDVSGEAEVVRLLIAVGLLKVDGTWRM